mmetsp:Transcript_119735/g.284456  ORF Transcript_119735/g.284456 Transcript_119735/m.284456 type:complete len:234 (-) Transcript_119735:239-940(-)
MRHRRALGHRHRSLYHRDRFQRLLLLGHNAQRHLRSLDLRRIYHWPLQRGLPQPLILLAVEVQVGTALCSLGRPQGFQGSHNRSELPSLRCVRRVRVALNSRLLSGLEDGRALPGQDGCILQGWRRDSEVLLVAGGWIQPPVLLVQAVFHPRSRIEVWTALQGSVRRNPALVLAKGRLVRGARETADRGGKVRLRKRRGRRAGFPGADGRGLRAASLEPLREGVARGAVVWRP